MPRPWSEWGQGLDLTQCSLHGKLDCMVDDSVQHSDSSPGRRAASYWFIDGLPEIISGLALALLGALWICFEWTRSLPWIERVWSFVAMLLLLTVLFGWERNIVQYIKARLTYPRTGYVRPPVPLGKALRSETIVTLGLGQQPPPDENVTAFRERTVVILFLGGWAVHLVSSHWGPPLIMSAVAFAVYVLNRDGERRYRWWSTLFLPAAAFLSVGLDLPGELQRGLVYVIGGVWLLAQGAWTLYRYVRTNPRLTAVRGLQA